MEGLRARIKRFERELHILGMILVIGAVLGVGGWLAGSGEAGAPVPVPTVTAVQSAAVGTPRRRGLCLLGRGGQVSVPGDGAR